MSRRNRFHPSQLLLSLSRPLDQPLLLILLALLACGTLLIESAAPELLGRQFMNIALSLFGMWVVAFISTRRLLALAPVFYIVGVALLIAVALFGSVSKGAQRWLDIGALRIQPSEIMKVAMPLILAWFFHKREQSVSWWTFLLAGLLLLGPVYLIAKQPDLGTAILVCASGFFVIFFAGLSWKLIAPCAIVGVVAIIAITTSGDQLCQPDVNWPGLKTYQKERVCTLLDPSRDPLGKGFHTIQSTIAIGSGGFIGKGWKQGTQTHLAFLPERHTDFIFAVLSEEFGLVGVLILLGLYMALLARGFMIAARASTFGTKLLASSTTMVFFTYLFVNIGMVSGILPVVGVPLPFISYGGTAVVTLCLGVGILMGIARNRPER